jgi:Spy/CpxP family protein refolding chaperone
VCIDLLEGNNRPSKETTMLGLIFGTVCLIGLVKVLRGGHGWYGGRRTRRFGGRWLLRSVFERLDTTPGQEKVIVSALDELRDGRRSLREELKQTRADLARVVQGGLVDDSSLEETFARHDRLLASLRVSFVEAIKKITEALDERQRKQVADMLEGGAFMGRGPRCDNSHQAWPSAWA